MPHPAPSPDAHPYLRAATAGIRHHARHHTPPSAPVERPHLDTLHTHLVAVHQLLDHLADATGPKHPAAGRHLAAARTRLWQASAAVHDAFHTLPPETGTSSSCDPHQLPEGPSVLTICQRHLAAGHTARRKTTPTDLHPHTTACAT